MTVFRVAMMILAVINFLFTGITAAVGGFADGGDVWSRLIVSGLHPISAIAIVLLVFLPRPRKAIVFSIGAILLVNIIADVALATSIATGAMKGDWELPLVFSVMPMIAIIYGVTRLRSAEPTFDD